MKTSTFILFSILATLLFLHIACSPEEEQRFALDSPGLAPTTRAAERVQRQLDPIAQRAEQISHIVQKNAEEGATIGVPGAGIIALIASAASTMLGAYNQHRKGTVPLKSALQQVVQSVESAFPEKTDKQKSAMAAMQDRLTRRLVAEIKGA